MNIQRLTRITSLLLVVLMVMSLIPSRVALAAGNTLFVTPASQSVQKGTSFTIQVKGNVDAPFSGESQVSGTLTFPRNLLSVTSVSTTGATMNWQVSATPNNSNGTVAFSERALFPVNGAVHIMSVTFSAIANGTASVGFAAGSGYGAFGGNATLSGGTYTITTPPPPTCPAGQVGTPPNCTTPPPATCPSGQVGTPPNCTTPQPTSCPVGQVGTPPNCKTPTVPTTPNVPTTTNTPPNPSPGETAAPAVIPSTENDKGLSISDTSTSRSYKTATLSWKTSASSKNVVTYGVSLKKLDKTAEVNKLPDGTYEAKMAGLTPGKQYYFTIVATGETDSTKTDSYSGVFTTKGFPVVISITASGTPVANAKVKIGEQTYSTDKSGQLNLELASGSYDVSITSNKGSKNGTIAVAAKTLTDTGKAPAAQKFNFEIPTAAAKEDGGLSPFTIIGALVGGLALLGLIGGVFVIIRRRREQNDGTIDNPLTVDNNYNWNEAQPLPAFPQEQVAMNTQGVATEVTEYADPSAMMPPEVPLAPVEEPASIPADTPNLTTSPNQFQGQPLPEAPGEAYEPQDTPQPEVYSEPAEQSLQARSTPQDPVDNYSEEEIATPPPPPAPDVPLEDNTQYAEPDTSSMPLPPEDGEPDAEIIGNELQINHHHSAASVPDTSVPDPTELEIKNQA